MAVPDYQSLMLPLLQFAARKGTEISTTEALETLAKELSLTEDDLKEMLPSRIQSTFANRVGWASTYMKKAGLLEATRRGFYQITDRGRELLGKQPKTINVKLLKQYPEFLEFKQFKGTRNEDKVIESKRISEVSTATPSEALESAYENLRDELAGELLGKLKKTSPSFFERVVVELLVKMGYGGSRTDAGKAIGRSGDGGIDGIIKEDKLGLDVVYIQAKRWDNNPVGRPDVMQFAGALQAQRANKGIFITTSRFTYDARSYVSQIGSKIVLIDGAQLTSLMIEHDVGVSTISLYPVKKVDSDYFEESI
ncbi:MAG TPA: restriction endonuclease [Smithellaceae bacterium]|jgi:restriction system protein|uniref:restriction endonuclease n=1 Tax=Acidaminobacter sp. TaxID=1872102 RepID=UPI001380718A|nr:restriction endonuclease [Acidaminobacter sp.]MBP9010198.1 restriction endonuclease [Syntrophaceae bacterium]MZQ99343.1 restriction endonuclease [Acidaminobacter sp.]HPV48551.1 restriction endonuclease [Smithellaceae bacterium]